PGGTCRHKRNRAQRAPSMAMPIVAWGGRLAIQAPAAASPRRSAAADPPHRGVAALAEELARVHHAPVLPHLEMYVGAGGTAGGAGLGHFLPGAHQVALAHAQPRVVRIAGDVAVAVVHVHDVAIAAL